MSTMRISQLAERTGVPATTLRFYEGAGLLPAGRTPAGYRVYGEDAVDRLAFIGAAKHLGLPLDEIGELLGVWEAGACADVKADLWPRIAARLSESEQRLVELTAFTASLHAALEHLDALPDRAGRCGPECGFLGPAQPLAGPGGVEVTLSPSPQAAEREGEMAEREGVAEWEGEIAEQEGERWRSAPVACSLSGEGIAERTARWHQAIDGAHRTEIRDGLRLTLPAERVAEVAALAAAEERCCPFFDFRFHLDAQDLHLEVRTPAGGAGLLADLFDPVT